ALGEGDGEARVHAGAELAAVQARRDGGGQLPLSAADTRASQEDGVIERGASLERRGMPRQQPEVRRVRPDAGLVCLDLLGASRLRTDRLDPCVPGALLGGEVRAHALSSCARSACAMRTW